MKRISIVTLIYIFIASALFGQQISQPEMKSIDFIGNENIPDSELELIITQKASTRFWPIKVNRNEELSGVGGFLKELFSFGAEKFYFDSTKINYDIELIKKHYRAKGFFKTKVSYNYKDDESNDAYLTFIINEKEPSTINEIKIKGLEKIYSSEFDDLVDRLSIEKGERYDEAKLKETEDYILHYFGDRGRLFIDSEKPKIVIDTLDNLVDIELNFSLGKTYKISEVRLEKKGINPENIDDNLIKDIVGIEKGRRFSFYDLQQGQVRLYRTNLFNSASIFAVKSDTSGHFVPLLISTSVAPLYEIYPEIIINDEDGFNLGFSFGITKKNFFGNARRFTLNTSIVSQDPLLFIKNISINSDNIYGYADFRAITEQPFLFGKQISTRNETYYTFQRRKDIWNAEIIGTKLNLDFELPRYTYLTNFNIYLNWEHSKFNYFEKYVNNSLNNFKTSLYTFYREENPGISNDSLNNLVNSTMGRFGTDFNTTANNAVIGFSFDMNHSNDLLYPTEGVHFNFLMEDGNSIPYLYSKIFKTENKNPSYYKLYFKSSYYHKLFNSSNSVFAFKFNIGNIHTYYGNKYDIPLNQRFYAGGSNSVRGWGVRDLVPNKRVDALITSTLDKINKGQITQEDFNALFNQGIVPGGFFILESSMEIRNKIFGDFGSAIFIDVGNTWDGLKQFRIPDLAVAAGFGIRYFSPFAPFRLDFGFRVYDPSNKKNFFDQKLLKQLEIQIGIGEAF